MIRRGERAARVVDIAGRLVMMVSKHMDMVPGYEGGEVRSVNFDPTIWLFAHVNYLKGNVLPFAVAI